MLPPVMLADTDTTEPNTLEPVTVPVAEISPPVKMLPPVTFPLKFIALLLAMTVTVPPLFL